MNRYFVYTGNAYPHKNLSRLLEAIVELNKESDKPVELKIASSRNIFISRLESLIKRLNAGDYVKLLGFVPDEKLAKLYKDSVAFVFPSLSEGFGLPGMEAMEAGTLVLASDIPVFREVYNGAAIYFNPYDFSSVQKAMRSALDLGEVERKAKIKYAQKFVKRYSWEKMARETLNLYQSFS